MLTGSNLFTDNLSAIPSDSMNVNGFTSLIVCARTCGECDARVSKG